MRQVDCSVSPLENQVHPASFWVLRFRALMLSVSLLWFFRLFRQLLCSGRHQVEMGCPNHCQYWKDKKFTRVNNLLNGDYLQNPNLNDAANYELTLWRRISRSVNLISKVINFSFMEFYRQFLTPFQNCNAFLIDRASFAYLQSGRLNKWWIDWFYNWFFNCLLLQFTTLRKMYVNKFTPRHQYTISRMVK